MSALHLPPAVSGPSSLSLPLPCCRCRCRCQLQLPLLFFFLLCCSCLEQALSVAVAAPHPDKGAVWIAAPHRPEVHSDSNNHDGISHNEEQPKEQQHLRDPNGETATHYTGRLMRSAPSPRRAASAQHDPIWVSPWASLSAIEDSEAGKLALQVKDKSILADPPAGQAAATSDVPAETDTDDGGAVSPKVEEAEPHATEAPTTEFPTRSPAKASAASAEAQDGGSSHGAMKKLSKKGDKDIQRKENEEVALLTVVFWGIMPTAVVLTLVFEAIHRRWAGIDLSQPVPGLQSDGEAVQNQSVNHWLDGLWPLTKHFFFQGPMQGLARFLFVILVTMALFRLFLTWCINQWESAFWDSIEKRHTAEFWRCMLLFLLIAVVNVLTSTYNDYITSMLVIRWRTALTMTLQERWLIGRAFYLEHFPPRDAELQRQTTVDNPDQRLQEDISGFVGAYLSIFFAVFQCCGTLMVFTPVLFNLSPSYAFGVYYCPGWLLYVSVAYSLLGSFLTHTIGRTLLPLSFLGQRMEANYRHAAMEVRDHTLSIAMYGSEGVEHERLTRNYDLIQRVTWENMRFAKHLGFFRNFYFLANDVVPFCILAGNYFKGQITLGQMMQILNALRRVQEALSAFVSAYPDITNARATIDRLYHFWNAVEFAGKHVKEATVSMQEPAPGSEATVLCAQNVNISLPNRTLWENAQLTVKPGERVILLGRDGSGKSVFLRAVAGIWPAQGLVRLGGDKGDRGNVLFVPQKPFLPPGSLRAAVSYPEGPEEYDEQSVRDMLQAVRLKVLDDVPLDEVGDWGKRLSGGEQQRLAFAHAMLRRPTLLVLDETTAAIGEAEAAELYEILGQQLPESTAVVTVAHEGTSPSVEKWHNIRYKCNTETHKWMEA